MLTLFGAQTTDAAHELLNYLKRFDCNIFIKLNWINVREQPANYQQLACDTSSTRKGKNVDSHSLSSFNCAREESCFFESILAPLTPHGPIRSGNERHFIALLTTKSRETWSCERFIVIITYMHADEAPSVCGGIEYCVECWCVDVLTRCQEFRISHRSFSGVLHSSCTHYT